MERIQFTLHSKYRKRQEAIPGLATQSNVLPFVNEGSLSGLGTLHPSILSLPW